MKLLVCGKGGCGKSTIAALLAKEVARREREVLVVDNDESNFGLHSLLGMERPRDFRDYFGGKKVLFERAKALKEGLRIGQLPQEYLADKGDIKLLAMGRIYDFGEGCACPINALSSKFLENLDLGNNEFLIADTDAGVEHLGRGVERGCDLLLVVVEPSGESIELAGRITEMVRSLGKNVYYVLNKIDEETKKSLLDALGKGKVIAAIPEDGRMFKGGLEGRELDLKLGEIERLAEFLEARRRPRHPLCYCRMTSSASRK